MLTSGPSRSLVHHRFRCRRGDFCTEDVQKGIPIGKGGNATVYLGMNTQTKELVAIKVSSLISSAHKCLLHLPRRELLASRLAHLEHT